MKTFTAAALAEAFEVDRNTMIRALRSTPPDLEKTADRPTYKIATAAKALERHRRGTGTGAGGDDGTESIDIPLAAAFAQLDAAIASMTVAATLERRRSMAIEVVKPLLAEADYMLRVAGRAAGHDAELVALRADHLGLVMVRAFERPCEWSFTQAQNAVGI